MSPDARQDQLWEKARCETFLIVGLSERTGMPAARLLASHAVPFRVSDSAPPDVIKPRAAQLGLDANRIFLGPQTPIQLDGITQIIVAPGVPKTLTLLVEARRRAIPVWSDIDFLYEFIAHKKTIAITGTDGKTTTTTLVGELLRSCGKVAIAGNIGTSVLCMYEEILGCDWLVLELSSFMLEDIRRFRADISVILNIAQDHIDRYPTLDAYAEAKFRIVQHARAGDLFVKNLDDPRLATFLPPRVTIRTISTRSIGADATFCGGTYDFGNFVLRAADIRIKGVQNQTNILAAATIAREVGVPSPVISEVLGKFPGVRHRMQHLGSFAGVEVYDDSKASNVHAVSAALCNFDQGVVLILGGRDKGLDFSILHPHRSRLRSVVCYGEDGEKIRDCLGFDGAFYAYRFEDAVRLAVAACRPGDVLLLSPGCTSWDQFPNYEVRGDVFQALIAQCFEQPHASR
jgi:UDP-N-acetylmuramoylalanine--D-glutamate ligase